MERKGKKKPKTNKTTTTKIYIHGPWRSLHHSWLDQSLQCLSSQPRRPQEEGCSPVEHSSRSRALQAEPSLSHQQPLQNSVQTLHHYCTGAQRVLEWFFFLNTKLRSTLITLYSTVTHQPCCSDQHDALGLKCSAERYVQRWNENSFFMV